MAADGPQLTGSGAAASSAAAATPYALIVESMTEGVSLASEDGVIVYTNAAEDAMFGYGPGELVGRHVAVQNAYPPEENERRVAEVIATLKEKGVWEGEWHNRRKDGSDFYTASRITAVAVDGRTHWLCVQRDVTAMRAAEAAHRESEERLELAIEGTGVGIYDLDLAAGTGFWSESAFRMLGYEPAPDGRATFEMWRSRLHPEDEERVLAEHGRAEAGGGDLRFEFRIRRADTGEERWLASYGRIIDGRRSIGTVLDITDRKRTEEALRENEARLRLAMEAGRLGSWWFDPRRGRGGFSKASVRMLGLPAGKTEASYEEWRALIHPDDLADAEAAFAAALAGETPGYEVEYRVVRADGEERRLEVLGTVERGPSGEPLRVVGTFRDVTRLRAAAEASRESAQRLDLAVSAHRIGIFDWHAETGAVLWTAQEEELFGLPPGSFGGDVSDWAACVHPDDVEPMNRAMAAAMAERRETFDFAFRIVRPGGDVRWIEGSSRILYAEDGTPLRMVGTNMDVTERRRAEEHQRLLVNELNHRVKNTLAIIQGIAQQTFRGSDVPAARREAFEGRLAALSDAHNLLTRENWDTASIREVLETAVEPYRGGEGRVTLEGPDLRLAPRTAVSLALAVHELGTNAAKYGALSAAAGRVSIRWTAEGGRLGLLWEESGGPAVTPPETRGFGTRMIERALAPELGGEARIDFRPSGLVCSVGAVLAAPSAADNVTAIPTA
jgi:PAS domain S-box-containing protein